MAKKKKAGRPNHVPTPAQRHDCELYAGVGVPHHHISVLLGISTHTLLKYYAKELDLGKARANAQMGGALFKNGLSGNATAQIFWMKAQAGWREKQIVEHSGLDGKPIAQAVATASITDDDAMKSYLKLVTEEK